MSGKLVLNLAMSLDGYIADEQGGYDWIAGQGDVVLDTEQQIVFTEFLKEIDLIVMGRTCYDQGFAKDFPDHEIYVASHEDLPAGHVHFIRGDIVSQMEQEKAKGKRIYLFGGGKMLDDFIKRDVIDEYIIGIIPVILGAGRPLFYPGSPVIPLKLIRYSISEGITVFHYSKR